MNLQPDDLSSLPMALFAQAWFVHEKYPAFKLGLVDGNVLCVRFTIIDKVLSQSYRVVIYYKSHLDHAVFIEKPNIEPISDIHMFRNGSLCLYYKHDISPFDRVTIGIHLVRWTYRWVYSYEIWKRNGYVWPNPSVPHHMFMISPYRSSVPSDYLLFEPTER